jgi:coenzyme F420-reducing hydrogenase delta subunit
LDDERFRLSWISASEGQKFANVSCEYTDTITKKGENPTKNNIFL